MWQQIQSCQGCFFLQVNEYLLNHRGVFNTGDDFNRTAAFAAGFNIDIEYPYMDSSSFASTLFDDLRYDCSRIFGLEGWHALMPGHDGYSRAGSQLFHRALSTRVFTGFAGAGPTCSPSVSVLCNRG